VYTKELLAALSQQKNLTVTPFDDVKEIPQSADLIHITHFDPFFLTLPMTLTKPMVVTIHDLIPLVYPSHFPRGIRGELKWQIQRFMASRAARIITDSEASKKDILRFIKIKESRVDVVPLAPRAAFAPVANSKVLTAVLERYSLPMHFALYVGDVNWNKNVLGLLSAWRQYKLRSTFSKGDKLVLVGGAFLDPNLAEAKEIQQAIEALEIGDSVVRVGFVPDDDLQALYSLASVTVVPSHHEGFGFPILEAMACGGIAIGTNTSSIPEISGPAKLFNPNEPMAIATAIDQAIHMAPNSREAQVKKGLAWAAQYSWNTVATQTVAVYKKVLTD
jgi:glycosyltransferase involved in cell wall biosynthesis